MASGSWKRTPLGVHLSKKYPVDVSVGASGHDYDGRVVILNRRGTCRLDNSIQR
jgi:hypothetical protein